MTEQDLPSIPPGKYNPWCHRRVLACADEDRCLRAEAFSARHDLAPSERAAFRAHELTGCGGLEFVAFSNARLEDFVTLANGVILVPCFLTKMEGQDASDWLVQKTMRMEGNGRFVYDGWVPIVIWDEDNVREAVRSVDEALSVFCLVARAFFEWQPKYPAGHEYPSIYNFEDRHLQELEEIARLLDSLGQDDRVALYRSLAWLSQGLRLSEPTARLLFSILAIESLATYIEQEAPDQSPLAVLRAQRLTRTEREARREKCIDDTLSKWLEGNPTKAIQMAYVDCVVGIKRRLKAHLEHVLTSDTEPIALLFQQKVEGKSLYDLRHPIAHGRVDGLSEVQREQIRQRVWDAERVARRYILAILETALGAEPLKETMTASVRLLLHDAVVSRESMYRGPTHMAVVYS